MKPKMVYHSSQAQGLKRIVPRWSTHGRRWIYATHDPVMAAVFLGTKGGDFTCAVGRDPETGKPFIRERFAGAFDLRYGGVSGSIYILPGEKFVAGKTSWDEELVCAEPMTPLAEIRVADAKAFVRVSPGRQADRQVLPGEDRWYSRGRRRPGPPRRRLVAQVR